MPGHLVVIRSLEPLSLLSPMFSIYHLANFAQNHVRLMVALTRVLDTLEVRHLPPPPQFARLNSWICKHTICRWVYVDDPRVDIEERRRQMQQLASLLTSCANGDWLAARPQHYCHASDGRPCCANVGETKAKFLAVLVPLMQRVCSAGHLPRENQWFKLVQSLKPWALGLACHDFFGLIFRQGLGLDLLSHTTDQDLEERVTDDIKVIQTKRAKKACLFLDQRHTMIKALLAVIATEPMDQLSFKLQCDIRLHKAATTTRKRTNKRPAGHFLSHQFLFLCSPKVLSEYIVLP